MAASAAKMRSDPLGRSGSVSTACPPTALMAFTIAGSPAATTTGPNLAALACSQTRTIMGRPAISASGLPGRRVDAMRVGISRMGFIDALQHHDPALLGRAAGQG